MAFKRYIRDYSMELQTDARGKRRLVPVYRGARYDFVQDRAAVRRAGILSAVLCFFSAVFFAIILFMPGAIVSYMSYAAIPAVLLVFPIGFTAAACYNVLRRRPYLTREQSDKSGKRMRLSAAVQCILCVLAIAGAVVGMVNYGARTGDIMWCIAEAAILTCGVLLFFAAPAFETKMIEPGSLPGEEAKTE